MNIKKSAYDKTTKALFYSFVILLICQTAHLRAATLQVPSQYSSIQAAINASSNNDVIVVAAGVYSELLTINKAIRIQGAGMGQTIVRFFTQMDPIISIDGSGLSATDTVRLQELTVTGGDYIAPDLFFDTSTEGVTAVNVNLKLDNVSLNLIANYGITIQDGSLITTDVQLFPDVLFWTFQCDLGIQILNSVAKIEGLSQTRGNVDHTIDINGYINPPSPLYSDVVVRQCTIRSSELSWGECVRTYGNGDVLVEDCYFYRPPGGQVAGPAKHSGVSVNGPNANLWVDNVVMDSLPWGLDISGSLLNSNKVVLTNSTIKNCEEGGIRIGYANYEMLDMGGGDFGSPGNNNLTANQNYDVFLLSSSGDVYAGNNSWTNNGNPNVVIYDEADDPTLGRVLFNYTCPLAYSVANGNPLVGSMLGNGSYETDGIITSDQRIRKSADMIYDSGTSVTLEPGFTLDRGGQLEVRIDGCGP